MKIVKIMLSFLLIILATAFAYAQPIATIDAPTVNQITYLGDSLTFSGHGDGTVSEYKWDFNGAFGEEKFWSYVFITSNNYNANLGGLAGADAKVQAEADAAGLSGTYKAWLSTETIDVKDRIVNNEGGYKLPSGTIVKEGTGLVGSTLEHVIDEDATGDHINPSLVWTYSRKEGVAPTSTWPREDCNAWTSNTPKQHSYWDFSTLVGNSGNTDFWSASNFLKCDEQFRLYGLQQENFQEDDNIIKEQSTTITFNSAGQYTVDFYVKDNNNVWSSLDSIIVNVLQLHSISNFNVVEDRFSAELSWRINNPENSQISYDVYFGGSNPVLLQSNVQIVPVNNIVKYNIENLNHGSEYFWKIVARDQHGKEISSDVMGFATLTNQVPSATINPSPVNGGTLIPLTTTLTWQQSGDAEGDTVTYDVYFGTNANAISFVQGDLTVKEFSVSNLAYSTNYYWKVVSKDQYGRASWQVWSFTTRPENLPPYTAYNPSPTDNEDNINLNVMLTWLQDGDEEGDAVTYDVYFGGSVNGMGVVGSDLTSKQFSPANLGYSTTYYWKVVSKDQFGSRGSDVWRFTTKANQAPYAATNPSPANTATNAPLGVTLAWQQSGDAEGDAVTYDVYFGGSVNGMSVVGSGLTSKQFSPANLGYSTTYYWKVVSKDQLRSTSSAVWRFTTRPTNMAPVANAVSITTNEDTNKAITLSCSDADGDGLTYSIVSNPAHGSLSGTGSSRTYTPTANYNGADSFTYRCNDGLDNSNTATVSITVNAVNDNPVISSFQPASNPAPITEGGVVGFSVTAVDVDGNSLTYSWDFNGGATNSNLEDPGNIVFSTAGIYNVVLTVSDGNGGSATSGVTVSVQTSGGNLPPSLSSLPAQTIQEDGTALDNVFNLDTFGSDSNGDTLTYSIDSQSNSALVAVSIDASKNVDIAAPAANQNGVNNVCIKANDGTSFSNTECFDVTIQAVNDAPTIDSFNPTATVLSGGDGLNHPFSVTATDIDGDTLTYSWEVDSTVVSGATTNSYTFNSATAGVFTIKGIVNDDQLTAEQSWTITVSDKPITSIFTGDDTIDFSTIQNLAQATNIVLDKTDTGKINFGSEILDLTDVVDLDNNVVIQNGLVGINTVGVFSALNKPAIITMRGLGFTSTPTVYRTDAFTRNVDEITQTCPSNICTVNNYDASTGTLQFSVTGFSTFAVKTSQITKLSIEKVDVKVGGKTDTNVGNGDTISKKAEPGDSVVIKIKLKNLYTNNEDIEIQDITITATLRDVDDGEDIDEEGRGFDLKPQRTKSQSISLHIPLEVESGVYDLTLDIEAEDEDGNSQNLLWEAKLEIDKERHQLVISKANLGADTLECIRRTNLNIEILNIGRDDEDDVRVTVKNEDLGIDFTSQTLELDKGAYEDDNKYEKTLTIKLGQDFEEGTYPIVIDVYRDGKLEETETIDLVVGECQIKFESAEDKTGMQLIGSNLEPTQEPKQKIEVGFAESTGYLATLIVILIIVFALVVFLVLFAFKPKR